jgi:hypothetical protein
MFWESEEVTNWSYPCTGAKDYFNTYLLYDNGSCNKDLFSMYSISNKNKQIET